MQSPKITIGMAHYDDYEGVWSTVQSVFLHNDWESPEDVEIVIVDTSPIGSDHRRLLRDFVGKGGNPRKGARTPNIKLMDASTLPPGTTQSRNLVFKLATSPIVCVVDCHVLLRSNTFRKLLDWFESNPYCTDLIQGPMLYDNLDAFSTHFSDQFRGGMWGTWGTAWKSPKGGIFVCESEEITDENRERSNDGQVHYHDLFTLERLPIEANGQAYIPTTNEALPFLSWGGHELQLRAKGFQHLGHAGEGEPFEIPGCGMGLFASRRDSWLGFNPDATGFGGEELNIHTKYRQAGRKTICLPWLEWNHRFGRAGGAPYPLQNAAKIRNYVLWAQELGNPVSPNGLNLLDRIHTHFVLSGAFTEVQWQELISDAKNYQVILKPQPKSSTGPAIDSLFQEVATTARDLSQHAEIIQTIASSVKSITAFVKRADWEVMLVSGFPNTLDVYQSEESPLIGRTHQAASMQDSKDSRKIVTYNTYHKNAEVDPLKVDSISKTDLLVIDKENTAEYLLGVLRRHGSEVKSHILIRGTEAFGEKAEHTENQPGLWYALREWLGENPEWFISMHRPNQYGLTLLSKDPITRPETPIRPWPKGYGPGSELKAILGSVGLNPAAGCACNTRMKTMDEWGVEQCKEQKEVIVQWLIEGAESWGWTKAAADKVNDPNQKHMSLIDKALIGWKSITTGIAFKVDWTNPYPGLVTEAIKRAEEKEMCEGSCESCDKPGCKKGV